jgi:hypothetical protein
VAAYAASLKDAIEYRQRRHYEGQQQVTRPRMQELAQACMQCCAQCIASCILHCSFYTLYRSSCISSCSFHMLRCSYHYFTNELQLLAPVRPTLAPERPHTCLPTAKLERTRSWGPHLYKTHGIGISATDMNPKTLAAQPTPRFLYTVRVSQEYRSNQRVTHFE